MSTTLLQTAEVTPVLKPQRCEESAMQSGDYVHNYVGSQEFHVESSIEVPEGKSARG
jgi:hypothetical protein